LIMADILVDERDQKFVLFEQFQIDRFSESKLYSEYDAETYTQVLKQAKKLATTALMPANAAGDIEGCHFEDGKVTVPKVYHELWRLWNEGEWRRIDVPEEMGGHGMPVIVGTAVNEYFEAANLGFGMTCAMMRGAAKLIATFGTESQKKKYVEKILSGKWSGTMVLTESGAGSDVGAATTRAERNPDGTYSIVGSKMFITGGNQDLTENIVHLVLARVKGASTGTRGLSLFTVPKIRVNPDGSLGEGNDVTTVGIEKKLGIRGSPLCQLNFGEGGRCIGELVGKENQGMGIFFSMMNEARLINGRHGSAVGSTAYLHALAYAKERLQGTEINAPKDSGQVPIIKHPDVRRMLLQMKATTEGVRALVLYASYCMDRARMSQNKEEAQEWEGRASFLTPVTKAYGTEKGFLVTVTAMQVYGGYGYTKDYPIEQFMRDAKFISLAEGTNGIQALDLAGRKLVQDSEALFKGHLEDISTFCNENKGHPALAQYIEILDKARNELSEVSQLLLRIQKTDFRVLALYATPYLELFGDVTVGWLLLWQAVIAQNRLIALAREQGIDLDGTGGLENLVAKSPDAAFYSGKLASTRCFASTVLIQAPSKAQVIRARDTAALEIREDAF
jgi:alkylation response protein AidB-like acyl-CoA dehydrogenase